MHKKTISKTSAAVMAAAMAFNGSAAGVFNAFTSVAADSLSFEFEDASFTGDITVEDDSSASGGKYLKMTETGEIELTIKVDEAGAYDLTFYGGGIGGAKQQNLYINDASVGTLAMPASDTFESILVPGVSLKAGENVVKITKSWGWSTFDKLEIKAFEYPEIKATQTNTCDINATAETRSLMNYLSEVYGKHIISGQQEIYNYGPHDFEYEFKYLEDLTGHMPAIRGFDYGNFTCPAFGSDDGTTDRIIDWVKNKNGIATSSWHLNVPNDMDSFTVGSHVDFSQTSYNEKDNNFSPKKAYTEGTKENEYYNQALKTLATEFKKLEAEGIPIIWRPLHEAEGGGGETGSWFWWGKEGSEVYKELWKYTYDVLVNQYECHNLIWEWNSYDFATSADWYPGDEYVDIIGYDKYSCTKYLAENNWQPSLVHDDSAISSTFYSIMKRYDSAKMVAMAENDCFSTIENITSEKAGWLYFCTWYDGGSDNINFLTNPIFNTEEDTIAMYQSDYCITLDELPKELYSGEIAPVDPALTTTKATTTAPATTTRPVTEADPNKTYGDLIYDKSKNSYKITLPKAVDEFYLNVELPEGCTYANGGLGLNIEIDGEYYWVNIQWEATKSGAVKVNVVDDFLNCSVGTEVVEDEAIIEKVKAELGKSKEYEGQVWYAANGETPLKDLTDVKIIDAYILNGDSTTVTTTPAGNDKVTKYGDANCDGEITIADSASILQYLGDMDKYGLSDEGLANADCFDPGSGITAADALAVQNLDSKLIKELPVDEVVDPKA